MANLHTLTHIHGEILLVGKVYTDRTVIYTDPASEPASGEIQSFTRMCYGFQSCDFSCGYLAFTIPA